MSSALRPHRRSRGQSLAEFALVAPVILALVGGVIQFGVVFWAQNTLTQVVRDTGRWEATRNDCSNSAAVVTQANAIGASSALIGYTPWSSASTIGQVGVYVGFIKQNSTRTGTPLSNCPPQDNTDVDYVQVSITHQVPTFFPGLQYLPSLGTCDSNGCHINLTSTAQFRLEPHP